MLNYFNFKEFNGGYLLTNDLGYHAFLDKNEFNALVQDGSSLNALVDDELKEKSFIYNESDLSFSQQVSLRLRSAKSYVLNPTTLHILVVTTACNLECVYCQARRYGKGGEFMTKETAERSVAVALMSPSPHITFEFQGGEPLLNFDVIRHAIEYALSHRGNKTIDFSVVTNLSLLSKEMLDYFVEREVSLSTSLDGNRLLHNLNRPWARGGGSFDAVVEALPRIRKAGMGVGAILTTTRTSLDYARTIVDTYCELGFSEVFIRPLTPLGRAFNAWDSIGYQPKEFVAFYNEALSYIIDLNKKGIPMREAHARIVLPKILYGDGVNYMELRSPCGAAVGQMAYYANGDVFTCDEGRMLHEMGDSSFRLGNVYTNDYSQLVGCSACRATCVASVLESNPGCCDCVYQPYCGICPVVNLAHYGDLMPKTAHDFRCKIYSGIFDTIFSMLHNDNEVEEIFRGWC